VRRGEEEVMQIIVKASVKEAADLNAYN